MKILFLTTHLNAGGITSYLMLLARGLITRGHEVSVASSGGDTQSYFIDMGVTLITVDIKTKSELSPKLLKAFAVLSSLIKQEKFDVIHGQTRVTQALAYWLARQTKVPVVSTCHGFFKPRLHRKLFPCWGDAVISISEVVSAHLSDDLGVAKDKIHLVKSGVDLKAFPVVDASVRTANRRQYEFSDDVLLVGVIARLSDVKGQDILIRAMPYVIKQIPHVKCCLFGQGKEEALLKELVLTLDLNACVLFSDTINRVYECLSLLDVFVMPSRQEGLGLSVMEAQAAGIPVVASNVGGLPSLIDDEKTGLLVESQNPRALADAIVRLLKEPSLANKCRTAARHFVETNCSSDIMVDETFGVYESIA